MTNAGHSPVIAWPALAKAGRHVPIVLAGRGLSKILLCLACSVVLPGIGAFGRFRSVWKWLSDLFTL
jgi:hypothetical protein